LFSDLFITLFSFFLGGEKESQETESKNDGERLVRRIGLTRL
jgi:hypothetical protein